MTSKDFALFSSLRSVYVNEEPDRFNPYLLSLAKKEVTAPAKAKPAFEVRSVSSDDSDDDAIIIIQKKTPPKPVPRFS
jgi:hypothetical protein